MENPSELITSYDTLGNYEEPKESIPSPPNPADEIVFGANPADEIVFGSNHRKSHKKSKRLEETDDISNKPDLSIFEQEYTSLQEKLRGSKKEGEDNDQVKRKSSRRKWIVGGAMLLASIIGYNGISSYNKECQRIAIEKSIADEKERVKREKERVKREYEEKHAYEFSSDEISKIIQIKKEKLRDEDDFISDMKERMKHIILEPSIAYSRFSSNDKRDFERFSQKYDEVFRNYKEDNDKYGEIINKIDTYERSQPGFLEKLALGIAMAPIYASMDTVAYGVSGGNIDEPILLNSLGDYVFNNSIKMEKSEVELFNRIQEIREERENICGVFNTDFTLKKDESTFLQISLGSINYQFNHNPEDKRKSEIDKLFYFFYSRAKPVYINKS